MTKVVNAVALLICCRLVESHVVDAAFAVLSKVEPSHVINT